jgi:cytochrome c-type biogenesis protein CcmH
MKILLTHGPTARLVVLVGAMLLLTTSPALAGPDEVATSVSQKIMSPFCPGLTLHDCPSDAAADLRTEIAGWARDGLGEDQIIERLEAEYGAGVLASPPADGAGLVAWVLPVAGLLAAIGIGLLLARRWTRSAASTRGAGAVSVDPSERARLEAELREIREQA